MCRCVNVWNYKRDHLTKAVVTPWKYQLHLWVKTFVHKYIGSHVFFCKKICRKVWAISRLKDLHWLGYWIFGYCTQSYMGYNWIWKVWLWSINSFNTKTHASLTQWTVVLAWMLETGFNFQNNVNTLLTSLTTWSKKYIDLEILERWSSSWVAVFAA